MGKMTDYVKQSLEGQPDNTPKKDDFLYKKFTHDEIAGMSDFQRHALSNEELYDDLKEKIAKIASEPRDWSIPIEDPLLFGELEEPFFAIKHLIIKTYEQFILLLSVDPEGGALIESFTSKEKISSFIEALIQARDSAFPE